MNVTKDVKEELMNKYQLAIKELKESKIKMLVFKGQTEEMEAPTMFDLYHHEMFILEELVEKATPKSPNFNRGIEVQSWDGDCCSRGYTHDYWSCPNCDGYLCKVNDEDSVGEYCTQCGQRIVGDEEW